MRITTGKTSWLFITGWALLIVFHPGVSGAQEGPEPNPELKFDKAAQAILDRASEFITSIDKFKYTINSKTVVESPYVYESWGSKMEIARSKPNKIAMRSFVEETPGLSIVSDGESLGVFSHASRSFEQYQVPETFEKMSAMLMSSNNPYQTALYDLSTAVLLADPALAIALNSDSLSNLGEGKFEEASCDRIQFSSPRVDWVVWIEQGDKPLIHQIVADQTKTMRMMLEQTGNEIYKDLTKLTTYTLTGWELNTALPENIFELDTPENQPIPPHPLEAKPAPDFTASIFGSSETVKLSDLKGKIVILDFWATYCVPCIEAMPQLKKVSEEYKDRDVVLYAMNLGESDTLIQTFLKKNKIETNVLVDPTYQIAINYMVDKIPQTVIIDKQGIVRKVHLGIPTNMQFDVIVRADLDAIIGSPKSDSTEQSQE